MSATVALLTDFGTADPYVGVMKAVMARICPDVRFIDITHEIQPQNVRQAALILLNTYSYFAPGTVFLVVVDPGVGGTRRPIAAQCGDHYFVGPDNGVLSYVLQEGQEYTVVELSNLAYQLTPVSYTFHGRDIFAPAAAHLALGEALHKLGPELSHVYRQWIPQLKIADSLVTGQVIHIDRFGNVITSIGELQWLDRDQLRLAPRFSRVTGMLPVTFSAAQASVSTQGLRLETIKHAYGETGRHETLALVGSSGYLEIAVNQGNAAEQLQISVGEEVVLHIG